MKFTLVKVFNPASFGLNGDHYAVIADLPADLGGGRRVADLLCAVDVEDKQDVLKGFERAAAFMPYRRNQEGWEFDFLTEDRPGVVRLQSTAYVPEHPLTGGDVVDTYFHWMCWRARVGLWVSHRDRVTVSAADEARLLQALPTAKPAVPVYDRLVAVPAPARAVSPLLTRPAATL